MNYDHATRARHTHYILATLIALGGCSDDDTMPPDASGGDTGAPDMSLADTGTLDAGAPDMMAPDMSVPDMGSAEVPITGFVVDIITREMVAGTEVCVFEHPEVACDTSGADGRFTLSTTERGPLALSLTTADYADMLIHLEVGDEGGGFDGAPTIQNVHANGSTRLVTGEPERDLSTGGIASGVVWSDGSGPAVGATVTGTPVSGIGPVYQRGGVPDVEAEALADGQYYLFETDPGEITLTFAHPEGTCVRQPGVSWPGSDASRDDQTTVRIAPGYISVLGVSVCTLTAE